jgi:pre-rRNA-processing protein TSR3
MIPLVAYRDNSCDPRKCTVKKLERAGFLRIVKKISQIPRNTLLLDPTAEQALSPAVEDPTGTSLSDGGKPRQFWQTLQAHVH